MKKLIPVLIVAVAAMAFYFKDRWLPQAPGQANYLGYVEGETLMIAAPQAGRISVRPVNKGDKIKKGDPMTKSTCSNTGKKSTGATSVPSSSPRYSFSPRRANTS